MPVILSNFLDYPNTVVREIDQLALARYDNPFERKSFLEHKEDLPAGLAFAFNELANSEACKWVSRILDIPIFYADRTHYGGVFVYEPGDYLKPHVDAGIHPKSGLRKVVTALLYLTPATLSFYKGDAIEGNNDPVVYGRKDYFLEPNQLLLFTNHDEAWHAVPQVSGTRRIVITVSYMASPEFSRVMYKNQHTRAYFARELGETDVYRELRRKRASEEHHHEVYRTRG